MPAPQVIALLAKLEPSALSVSGGGEEGGKVGSVVTLVVREGVQVTGTTGFKRL